ncbi:hypothetical protein HFO09_29240 [Rhizobium laguerreae]|uniref:hypothetical protein n=1 Tax=Rhizobium laguerreae TaxID=1076926 RepID=UPI001C91EFD4|nr:hypothetical protein [Rhizobium laguerreae]MBY3258454.1 hypothetical protein [Rhizobium laguerreae]MBY3286441.1 hypothetical protein [Rhizobium laguerreae]MBY3293104.1 hypothetical protein [Rhizobium laguerreae]
MFTIKYDIREEDRTCNEYNWAILGRLIAECLDGSINQGARLSNGFEVSDASKATTREVRTFFTKAFTDDGEGIVSWFSFKNVGDLDYQESVIVHPTSDEDGLVDHLARHPLK